MKGLLSIGKVSKAMNVSIKSLRYYDEIGILKPAYINQETNYRYYTQDQLFILDAISLCIELGIPLKELPKYQDASGALDLRQLLFDGKTIAENKIRSMYACLDRLQNTLSAFETQKKFVGKSDFYVKDISARTILTAPFDEFTDSKYYSHRLLELFVSAERLGMKASYPSGLLYEYQDDSVNKFVFVHVSPPANVSQTGTPADILNIENVRTLPKGKHLCRQNKEHSIDQAVDLYADAFADQKTFCIIETDIIDGQNSKNKNMLEIQRLL